MPARLMMGTVGISPFILGRKVAGPGHGINDSRSWDGLLLGEKAGSAYMATSTLHFWGGKKKKKDFGETSPTQNDGLGFMA